MKSLPEIIAWYRDVETRRWKQIYHFTELLLIASAGLLIIGVLALYGEAHQLQRVLSLFILLISIATFVLAPCMLAPGFKRWQIFALTLGLGCGMGAATIAALFLVMPI